MEHEDLQKRTNFRNCSKHTYNHGYVELPFLNISTHSVDHLYIHLLISHTHPSPLLTYTTLLSLSTHLLHLGLPTIASSSTLSHSHMKYLHHFYLITHNVTTSSLNWTFLASSVPSTSDESVSRQPWTLRLPPDPLLPQPPPSHNHLIPSCHSTKSNSSSLQEAEIALTSSSHPFLFALLQSHLHILHLFSLTCPIYLQLSFPHSLNPVRSCLEEVLTDDDAARLSGVSATGQHSALLSGYSFTKHIFIGQSAAHLRRMKSLFDCYSLRVTRIETAE